METIPYITKISVCFGGNVDSGKSTLIGVLKGHKDDGRGSARKYVSQFKHELESGNTSSISSISYKIANNNAIIFTDLAGHEKYFKTTVYGILSRFCDYAIVVISASAGASGITDMTREHIRLLRMHKIPILFVMTRIDAIITGDIDIGVTKSAIDQLFRFLKKTTPQVKLNAINSFTDYKKFKENKTDVDVNLMSLKINSLLNIDVEDNQIIFPVLIISNLDQFGINVIKTMLTNLVPRDFWKINNIRTLEFYSKIPDHIRVKSEFTELNGSIFYINDVAKPIGLDYIVIGINRGNDIILEQKMFIGPINNKFYEVVVKTMRNSLDCKDYDISEREIKVNIDELTITTLGHHCRGCIQIKIKDDGSYKITRRDLRNSVLVSSEELKSHFHYRFKACINLDSAVYVSNRYSPIMNMANIRETIFMTLNENDNYKDIIDNSEIDKKILLEKDRPYVFDCRCVSKPVFMLPNTTFIIRNGSIQGKGMIISGFPISENDYPAKLKAKKGYKISSNKQLKQLK